MLIKQAGVHEGHWILTANFGLTAGAMGPTPEQVAPGIVVMVSEIGIQRSLAETPEPTSLDAAVVNPAPRRKT